MLLVAIILILFIIYIYTTNHNYEPFTSNTTLSNEGVQNLSSIYNKQMSTVPSMSVENDLRIVGNLRTKYSTIYGSNSDSNRNLFEFYANGDGKPPYLFYNGYALGHVGRIPGCTEAIWQFTS